MHWAAFTLILGAAAETDGGGDALAARRRLATRPYFVPPPDLTKNWLVHGADHRGARADWNPVCRRYEARTPPLAAAAARLRSQDQSIKRGPAPTLEEPRVAGNATRTEDVVALVRTTWARYCRNVVPAYRTWAALLPDAYAVAQEPNRSHAWINELPREMLDYRRDIRPGEQKRGPKGVRVPLYYGWKLMRYGRRGTLSRPVVVASQCRHVSHKNPCCAADAQLRFAHDLLARGSKAKWFLLLDDDVFVHTYALARALATLDPAKALALVAPATRGRAGGCAGLAAAALSRAALEAVGPAATGRGIDAASRRRSASESSAVNRNLLRSRLPAKRCTRVGWRRLSATSWREADLLWRRVACAMAMSASRPRAAATGQWRRSSRSSVSAAST